MRGKIERKTNFFILLVITIFAFGFSGCSVLTPYKSEFQCTAPYKGKCVGVKEAYEESKKPSAGEEDTEGKKGSSEEEKSDYETFRIDPEIGSEEEYRNSLQKELSALLESPVTPVLLPPKVMRILIFPYPDKSVLYMPRYIFMMTDKPEWVMGNYLIGKGSD